jgi:hypothetical protein
VRDPAHWTHYIDPGLLLDWQDLQDSEQL